MSTPMVDHARRACCHSALLSKVSHFTLARIFRRAIGRAMETMQMHPVAAHLQSVNAGHLGVRRPPNCGPALGDEQPCGSVRSRHGPRPKFKMADRPLSTWNCDNCCSEQDLLGSLYSDAAVKSVASRL